MSYLLTSELKRRTGKILDAAARKPQFVMRNGALFVIAKVTPDAGLLAAARQVSGSILAQPEVMEAERKHRNVVLSQLDNAEGW